MPHETDIYKIDINTDPAFADYRDARKKLLELESKEATLKNRDTELSAAIRNSSQAPQPADAQLSAPDNRRVRELLGADYDVPQDVSELEAERRTVKEELRIMGLAIDKQRRNIETIEKAAQREVRTRLVPQHKALAQAIVDRLKDLRKALLAECDFREELNDRGVVWGGPLLPAAIPPSGDRCYLVDYWLGEFSRGEGRYKLD